MKLLKIILKNFQPFGDTEQVLTLQNSDITLITGYNEVTGSSNGSGKCVAKGTKVFTKEFGEVEIQDLFEDCEEGDVIIPQEEIHFMTDEGWKEVEVLFVTYPEDLFELELEDGKKLVASKDHRVMTQRGWVKLKNLTENDEVFINS